ncbi:hypothetical protein E2C01_016989 [Portunus trituberculatus]|uniref:Uncharacterized protein n=1 Tax=Portunus trituberculatus TaxID=210409 RepID=A0A5B7DQH4_PORTR|nr:hypothetical protein [Portunus trituberculatus]
MLMTVWDMRVLVRAQGSLRRRARPGLAGRLLGGWAAEQRLYWQDAEGEGGRGTGLPVRQGWKPAGIGKKLRKVEGVGEKGMEEDGGVGGRSRGGRERCGSPRQRQRMASRSVSGAPPHRSLPDPRCRAALSGGAASRRARCMIHARCLSALRSRLADR